MMVSEVWQFVRVYSSVTGYLHIFPLGQLLGAEYLFSCAISF